ncbi:MAG: hypothetical protein DRP85_04120 [Candidatus Makaraimicrobium thalassicum]|nr:MAG: hypothetical protein DRP85_04120 [Candidatus Omnitrophota bacterium]
MPDPGELFGAANRTYSSRRKTGEVITCSVADGETIYKGTLVCYEYDGGLTGYVVPASDTADYKFAGVAMETCENTSSALHRRDEINLWQTGDFLFEMDVGPDTGGAWAALLKTAVYIVNDKTVDVVANTTNDILCGYITKVEDENHVWVRIDSATYK